MVNIEPTVTLDAPVKSLMKLADDQLLIRGTDDRLTALAFVSTLRNFQKAVIPFEPIGPR